MRAVKHDRDYYAIKKCSPKIAKHWILIFESDLNLIHRIQAVGWFVTLMF